MDQGTVRWIVAAVMAGQFVCGSLFVYFLLITLLHKKPRWTQLLNLPRTGAIPEQWLRMAGLSRNSASYRERETLLQGCGYGGDAGLYVLTRRIALILLVIVGIVVWRQWNSLERVGISVYGILGAILSAAVAALWDTQALESFRRYRAQRIIKEIHTVSSQLLYYEGSSLNIHMKLMRCLPYTSTIRGDLQRLLGEWYHDAGGAVRRFKERLGTADGASFAETVESLRLHEDETYYALLKERIEDYKAKIELAKESRKESASYVLFALAGIPILYTFQIFIYPWVQEGQKLFQSLNP
jgi:hypothetical protein